MVRYISMLIYILTNKQLWFGPAKKFLITNLVPSVPLMLTHGGDDKENVRSAYE